jgi:hypothetical protein
MVRPAMQSTVRRRAAAPRSYHEVLSYRRENGPHPEEHAASGRLEGWAANNAPSQNAMALGGTGRPGPLGSTSCRARAFLSERTSAPAQSSGERLEHLFETGAELRKAHKINYP